MVSSRQERAKSLHKTLGRLRIAYRAHLAWLEGYPVSWTANALQWQCVPRRGEVALVQIRSLELSRARRALNEILRESSNVELTQSDSVIPPLDRVDRALELAGVALRLGPERAPPWPLLSTRTNTVVQGLLRDRSLYPLTQALAWISLLQPKDHAFARWLESHAPQLADLCSLLPQDQALRTATILGRLAVQNGDKEVTEVLALLCNSDLYEIPTIASQQPTEALLSSSLGNKLLELLEGLLTEESRAQTRVLRLLLQTAPTAWVALWKEHWAEVQAERKERGWEPLVLKAIPRKERKRLRRAEPHPAPAELHPRVYVDALRSEGLASGPATEALELFLRGLPLESEQPGLRARSLVTLQRSLRDPRGTTPEVVKTWARLLRSDARALRILTTSAFPQSATLDSRSPGIFSLLLEELPKRVAPGLSLQGILALVEHLASPDARKLLHLYVTLVGLGRPPSWAAQASIASLPWLTDVVVWRLEASSIELASSLSGEDLELFCSLLGPIASTSFPDRSVPRLVSWFAGVRATDLLIHALTQRQVDRVLRWAQSLAALGPTPVGPALPSQTNTAWLRHYPKALQAPLALLAELPEGERHAARLLRRALPTPQALKKEIAALRDRLRVAPHKSLAAREASLLARLNSGSRLRPKDLEKLKDKIRRAALRGRAELVDAALDDSLFSSLASELRCETKPDWWHRDYSVAIVAAVAGLPTLERRLGFQLLAARSGPPPWLPWDHPKNRAFQARLEVLGLSLEPWLSDAPVRLVEASGRTLTLSLELDPLEILLMGERFSTCLSLGSFNFYSAVVNAVDINKRVLYARTPEGGVAGRCLLALTDQGHLLAFEPYAHDRTLGFDKLVAEYVRELALLLGTTVATSGSVSNVVSARWYDDGPQDLTGQLAPLADSSELRQSLLTIDPSEAVLAIETAFAPTGLDDPTLTRVLALPEIAARPEIALALAPRVLAARQLPWRTRIAYGGLLVSAGSGQSAKQVVGAPGFWPWLTRPCPECGWGCFPNLDSNIRAVAQIDPFWALRALRTTRSKGIRRWEQEQGERLLGAAIALRSLGRVVQARSLLERGVEVAKGSLRGQFAKELQDTPIPKRTGRAQADS